MKTIDPNRFEALLREARVKPRLRKKLRFSADAVSDWKDVELARVTDRTGDNGVLLIELSDAIFVIPYELSKRIADGKTGRSRPVICDFCFTWQRGSNAARISFSRPKVSRSVTFLCCADLDCSNHVRSKTKASLLSRAQLHEDLSDSQRVKRLKLKLRRLVNNLGLQPVRLVK